MKKKSIMKSYGDKRNNAKHSYLKEGDHVYMKQRKVNKWSTPYSKTIYDVVRRKGNMITVKDHDNNQYTRNISYFKKVYAATLPIMVKLDTTVTPNVRPKRNIKKTSHLRDYIL